MLPYVETTRLLFEKLKDRFKSLNTYYFHNTIYGQVYTDARHQHTLSTAKLLQQSPQTRVIILGDASMAPEELVYPSGSLYFEDEEATPSIDWLEKLVARFRHTVWLNPIPQNQWDHPYSPWTLQRLRELFTMEELSLNGIKKAVDHLNR